MNKYVVPAVVLLAILLLIFVVMNRGTQRQETPSTYTETPKTGDSDLDEALQEFDKIIKEDDADSQQNPFENL